MGESETHVIKKPQFNETLTYQDPESSGDRLKMLAMNEDLRRVADLAGMKKRMDIFGYSLGEFDQGARLELESLKRKYG